ncbi:killer cell lectin-like receptor subfamily F member 2 [Sorex araneus]|uniref:killer cell lectin-like receptor subfamily F member 2 n=1 Tax=Sorex araneus TaxID=42254 RepID=UPI0024340A32|nr:killer cell lectin-like receptor subfamily F member 2 [Sorex araneus]
MENEDGYMTLVRRTRFKSEQRSKDLSWCLRCYSLVLLCGCLGILFFMVAVIGLHFRSLSNFSFALTKDKNMDLHKTVNISSLGEKESTCPNEWLLSQGKCYRFSTSPKTWNKSQHDCLNLQSHLLVIQTPKELEFVQKNLKPGHPGWIGLHVSEVQGNQWMWIDEQPFVEQNSFAIVGPRENMNCAVITGSSIYSEDCNSNFFGICQRKAI